MPTRRQCLTAGLAGLASLSLGACGFALRRAPQLPFRTLNLQGFKPTSPMGDALRRALAGAPDTRLVPSAAQAEAVLQVFSDQVEKSVVASTSAALVRELQLRQRLVFELRTGSGRELISRVEISQSRDMTYNERDALAKEQEEQLLYRAMQDDIALQVLRRLAAVKIA